LLVYREPSIQRTSKVNYFEDRSLNELRIHHCCEGAKE